MTEERRRARQKRVKRDKMIITGCIVLVAFLIILIGRQGFLYITESSVSPAMGVDVSSYQLDVNWDGLEEEGFCFAFVKATEGSSHVDEAFETNWKEAHRTKMKVGAYHFLSFDTPGETQADNFISVVKKKHGMLPPAVDVELYGEYESALPAQETVDGILLPLLEKLEDRYGKKPILYANPYVYEKYLMENYRDYPVWISDPEVPDRLSDGRKWDFCQYSFSGESDHVAEGDKKVDLNYFNGSKWKLRHY